MILLTMVLMFVMVVLVVDVDEVFVDVVDNEASWRWTGSPGRSSRAVHEFRLSFMVSNQTISQMISVLQESSWLS